MPDLPTSFRSRPLSAGVLIVAAVLALPTTSSADPSADIAGRWGLGLEGGLMKLTEGNWDYSNVDQFGALNIARGLNGHWGLQFNYKYGYTRPGVGEPGQDAGWTTGSGAALYTTIRQPTLSILHRFTPNSRFRPVFGLGLGAISWKVIEQKDQDVGWFPSGDAVTGYDTNGQSTTLENTNFTMHADLGLDFFVNDNLVVNLGARYHILTGNDKDNVGLSTYWGPANVDANTALAEGYLGVTWWFGSGDRDKDGIPDKKDACPDEPEDKDGFNDRDGCPDPDNDGDGITDDVDVCPSLAEDLDGYMDEDGCPDPDNDGDGIIDARDACPDEPEDFDGYEDKDGCPDLDRDGDGVDDSLDKCPDTPADSMVDENGCEVIMPPVSTAAVFVPAPVEDTILEGVNFLSGQAELTQESIAVLAGVAFMLKEDPAGRVEIRGHTDSSGSADANRELSQQRAQSVLNTLVEMGVPEEMMTAVGYGEDQPIADNGTADGRARNRRVELHQVQ